MSSLDNVQKPGEKICAEVDESQARELILEHFGLEAESLKQLDGYDDKNFFFTAKENAATTILWASLKDDSTFRPQDGFVFKVMNSQDSKNAEVVEGIHAVMDHLEKNNNVLKIQSWIPSKTGKYLEKVELAKSDGSKAHHILRILTYIPGPLLKSITCNKDLFIDAGFKLGKIHCALSTFRHPVFDTHHLIWHTESLPAVRGFLCAIPVDAVSNGLNCRKLIDDVIDHFEKVVTPLFPHMTKSQIHGDFNEGNLIVRKESECYVLDGLLDFGDTSFSYVAFDIAIAMAYMMLQEQQHPPIPDVDVGGYVLQGFTKSITLTDYDWDAIIPAIGARFAVSLVMGAYANQMDPSNTYVLFTQRKGWDTLSRFWQLKSCNIRKRWDEMLKSC